VKTMPIYWPLLTLQLENEPKEVLVELSAALRSMTLPNGTIDRNKPWPPRPAPEPPNATSGKVVAAPVVVLRSAAATESGPDAGVTVGLAVFDAKLEGDGLGDRLAENAAELYVRLTPQKSGDTNVTLSWQPVKSKTGSGSLAKATGAGPHTKRITLE
jgi:hypothetical protein